MPTPAALARCTFFQTRYCTHRKRPAAPLPAGLSSLAPLFERSDAAGREWTCGRCGDSRNNNKFFCLRCLVPVGGLVLPRVALPCKLDIIRHPKEKRSEPSSAH